MKKLFLFAVLAIFALNTNAQVTKTTTNDATNTKLEQRKTAKADKVATMKSPRTFDRAAMQLERFNKTLIEANPNYALTDDQKVKMTNLYKERVEKRTAYTKTLDREKRSAERAAKEEAFAKEISVILTPEQMSVYKNQKAKHQASQTKSTRMTKKTNPKVKDAGLSPRQ